MVRELISDEITMILMDNRIIGSFLSLHGLVYAILAVLDIYPAILEDVSSYTPLIGWTGHSWLLSGLINDTLLVTLALVFYLLSAALFIISGIIFMGDSHSWRVAILTSCIIGTLTLIVFWDGSFSNFVGKGGIGLILNIIIAIFVNHK